MKHPQLPDSPQRGPQAPPGALSRLIGPGFTGRLARLELPFLLLALPLALLLGCSRSSSSTPPLQASLQATFVRSGVMLEHAPAAVRVERAGQSVPTDTLLLDGNRQLLVFAWQPGQTYQLRAEGFSQDLEAPLRASPVLLRTLALPGDAPGAASALLDSTLAFSPDGLTLAVGTLFGDLLVSEVLTGKLLWKKKVPEGMIKRVAFSPDGTQLYVGEQSPDGFLYAVDARTGAERWRRRLADDLEPSRPPAKDDRYAVYFLPGIFELRVADDGRVMVAGTHSWNDAGVQKNRSRLYVFLPDGTLDWQFPAQGVLDGNVITFGMDRAGSRLLFSFSRSAQTPPAGELKEAGVYALDLRARELLWGYQFPILLPWFKEVFVWEAVSVTPDGARAIVGLGDGRAALFDLSTTGPTATPVKLLDLGTPLEVSGVPIATPVSYTYAQAGMLYAQTNNSNIPFGTEASSRTPPAPHPAAGTLFAIDTAGVQRWRYQGPVTPSGIWGSDDGRTLMMTTANPAWETSTDKHGLIVLERDPAQPDAPPIPLFSYPTTGPVFFHAAMSPDGRFLAVVESPSQHPQDQRVYGSYQVHVLH